MRKQNTAADGTQNAEAGDAPETIQETSPNLEDTSMAIGDNNTSEREAATAAGTETGGA